MTSEHPTKSGLFAPGSIWLAASLFLRMAAGILWAGEDQPFPTGNPHGFELKLPAGWSAVEPNLLAWIRASRSRPLPGLPASDGLYAYSRDSATNGFDPPYIIIAVKGGGRAPDRFWRSLSKPGEAFRQIDAGLRQISAEGCRLLSASFDTNRLALRVEMEIESEFGPLHAVGVSFLTENGSVEIGGLLWPSNYAVWSPTIEEVVSSFRLADWLKYRPRKTVDLSGGTADWLYPAAFIALVVAGGWAFIRFLRRGDAVDV